VKSCLTQKSLWSQGKKIWNQEDKSMQQQQPHQSSMAHHVPRSLFLNPGASRHPYAHQPHQTWEVVPNVELNNNQVGPLYPPFNQDTVQPGPPLPRYQHLVYAHRLDPMPPYYSQMPVMRRQMDSRRNSPANQSLQNTDAPAAGAPTSSALKPPDCPVCMEPLQDLSPPKVAMMTPCGHFFCSVCLAQALNTKNQCPTCRKRVLGVKVDGARRAFL